MNQGHLHKKFHKLMLCCWKERSTDGLLWYLVSSWKCKHYPPLKSLKRKSWKTSTIFSTIFVSGLGQKYHNTIFLQKKTFQSSRHKMFVVKFYKHTEKTLQRIVQTPEYLHVFQNLHSLIFDQWHSLKVIQTQFSPWWLDYILQYWQSSSLQYWQ